MYARLVHVKLNTDGRKSEGMHCPSVKMQATLLEDFYRECQIDATSLEFLECHGTGTKVMYRDIFNNTWWYFEYKLQWYFEYKL